MRKKTILNALSYLKKIVETDEQKEAIKLLESVAKSIEEKKNDARSDGFPLPEEAISESAFTLYSDGACRGNPGPGAWASMGQDLDGKIIFERSGVDTKTTNNQMELDGAINALLAIQSHFEEEGIIGFQKVYLYSDSKYVVDGIEKWVPGWKRRGWRKSDNKAPENVERWMELDEVTAKLNVKFFWVRGHSGHPQNERCDLLANQALDQAGF